VTQDELPDIPQGDRPHDDGGQRATGIALIILGILGLIVGIFEVPSSRLLLLVPIGLGLLPGICLIPAVWKWRYLRVALIPILCSLMLLCGFVVIHKSLRSKPTAESHGGPSPRTSTIAILHPQNGALVKECPKIDGTGTIPPNMGLWFIVVPDAAAKPKAYWIEAQAKRNGPDSWSAASPASIGPPDANRVDAYIYAVLIDGRWSTYFAKSTAAFAKSTAEPKLWATLLPPHNTPAAGPVTVTRVAEPSGASCNS
jgi:hypothetical protein